VRWKTEAARRAGACTLAALAFPAAAEFPGKITTKGEVTIESRAFTDGGADTTKDRALGLFGRFEWQLRDEGFETRLRAFGRVDAYDSKRSIGAIEEAFVQWKRERLRVRVGADIVNWSATEAFHPADTINARNLDSDIENFEKLGEPMVAVQLGLFEATTLQLFYFPAYVDSVFPSPRSRLSLAPPGIDVQRRGRRFDRDGRLTTSRFGPQAAVRVQQTVGQAEIAVHFLEHMDRLQGMPVLDLSDGKPALVFQTQRQLGVTYQQAFESGVLAKFEASYEWFKQPSDPAAAAREANLAFAGQPFPNRNHATYAAGLEYGIEHGWGSSTLVAEGQAIAGIDRSLWAITNLFPRSVLLGYRLAFASQDSRELRLAYIFNLDESAQRFLALTYEQRLGEQWRIKAGARIFTGVKLEAPIGFDALARGDHVFANLEYHF